MKKLILIFAVFFAISCTKKETIDYVIVSGQILNTKAKELSISSEDRKEDRKVDVKFKIDSEGKFNDTIRGIEGIYGFYDGKNYEYFYMTAGNNIKINYDANDFKNTLVISGVGSEASNYLKVKKEKVAEIMGDRTAFYKMNESEFKVKSKEIKEAALTLVSNFEGLTDSYLMNEKKDIQYNYLYNISAYQNAHSYYTKNSDFKVSPAFLSELSGVDYNIEEDFLNFPNYGYLLISHYNRVAEELQEKDSIERDIAQIKVAGNIPNETIKNALLSNSIAEIKYSTDKKEFYDLFMAVSTNEDNKKEITDIYNKIKLVADGMPSPKFVDYENNAGGTMSLDDLKGKYVYIDVWATWCGPCVGEIPFLKKVEEKYHDKNIHFLSLSIDKDKDHDKWKQMIIDKELGGIQLLADKAWGSKFVQDFQINGIPHFILIDPEGNIVKYSAPRPSNEKLIDLFDSLDI